MQRRTYLQVVGVSAVSAAAASPAEATEHTGYGDSGYGEIPYGGSDDSDGGDDTTDEIGDPVVEYLALSDTSSPNPHVNLVTEWVVSHPDGELAEVDISIRTDAGSAVDSIAHTVSGSRAEGTEETEIKQGAGDTYVVTVVVTDTAGNTASKMDALETAR